MNEHIAAEIVLLEAEREIDRLRAENAALCKLAETRLKRLRKREGIRKELSMLEISAMEAVVKKSLMTEITALGQTFLIQHTTK